MTEVIYFADTECEKQRMVYNYLFGTMRWTYWWEIAANLKYTNLNIEDMDNALESLVNADKVETALSQTGTQIWRVVC